jgi:hypothetical protein
LLFGESEKLAVLDGRPSHLAGRLDLMPRDVVREPTVDALVEEYPH